MTKHLKNIIVLLTAICISSCAGSKFSNKSKETAFSIVKDEERDVIDYAKMEKQMVPVTFAMRNEKVRGLDPVSLIGGAVSLASDGIKMMINNEKKKYTASYTQSINELYFYDQLSLLGPYDPLGLQFNGLTLIRTFDSGKGVKDTALYIFFELIKDNPGEIINNSSFRLKLKDIKIKYSQAKIHASKWYFPWTLFYKDKDDKFHMDIQIVFKSSYIQRDGEIRPDVTLGGFYLTMRDIPLNPNEEGYQQFYDNLRDKPLDGRCFIVPRSFGYHYNEKGLVEECYSQGEYNVQVKVTESSNDDFISKSIMDNSDMIVDEATSKMLKEIKGKMSK